MQSFHPLLVPLKGERQPSSGGHLLPNRQSQKSQSQIRETGLYSVAFPNEVTHPELSLIQREHKMITAL